jgi:cytochrome c
VKANRIARALALAGVLAGLGGTAFGQTSDPSLSGVPASGQRLAQRHCGGCHAVTGSASPLADAPPFNQLFTRYSPGRLDAILAEGMLAPPQRPEEGSPRTHPRMPMAQLDDDEVADLKAYLRSLDPRPKPGMGSCRRTAGCRRDD